MQTNLKKLITEYSRSTEDKIHETKIRNCVLSILQIRDLLQLLGNILYEDLEQQIYAASMPAGFGKLNTAVIALHLTDNELHVACYAKEGLLNQKSYEKVFSVLEKAAHGKKISSKRKNIVPIISFLSLVILAVILVLIRYPSYLEEKAFSTEVKQVIEATKEYNTAVLNFNSFADDYNNAVTLACIDNLDGFPSYIDSLITVSETFDDNADVLQSANSTEKIRCDTNTVLEMTEQVKQATAVVKQLTAPSEKWVTERLQGIEIISEIQAVTEDQNPDGLLDADGGYSSCIYFSVDAALPNEVPGDTIVEKGTDAGGAVEIYSTLSDAEARVEYLQGFDGTILYSGSYALIGTMVVRVSYKLSDEIQLQITDQITYALTVLES